MKQKPGKPKFKPGPAVGDGTRLHPHFKKYMGYCFYKSAMNFRARLDQRLAPFGLIAPQFGILSILKLQGSITQSELGLYMSIDKATMVRMLDGLEDKKMVTRVPSKTDRREKNLEITKSGIQAAEKMEGLRGAVEKEFLSPLSATERAQLETILDKLISSVSFKS